jgi:adenylylsulfate kinase
MTIHTLQAAPYCIWITGLSGAGKNTLAQALFAELQHRGTRAFVLDGDQLRQGLCADHGFSGADRDENIRRAGAVARLMFEAGLARVRQLFPAGRFIEVYLSMPVASCAARDPKGLYARAASGTAFGLTGVQSPYEAPEQAELTLDTSQLSVQEALGAVLALMQLSRKFN